MDTNQIHKFHGDRMDTRCHYRTTRNFHIGLLSAILVLVAPLLETVRTCSCGMAQES